MRYSLKLWVVLIASLNIVIFFIGLEFMNIENKFDKYDEKTRQTAEKIESRVFTDNFVKIYRRNDDKIHQIFVDKKFILAEQIEKNQIHPDKDIEKARLVGVIVPLESSFSKTAIIEYDMPPRNLRLRQGDIIPGTNWKVKNIDDREILLNNNSIDIKIKLK